MNDALDPSPPAIEVVSFLNVTIDLPKNDKFTSHHLGGNLYEISFNPRKKRTEGGNVPSNVRDMMLSQKIAPDLLDKGLHFNVGKIELKAIKEAFEALESPTFRDWLMKHAEKGFEMASQTGNAKALEFKFLIAALKRMQ